MARLIDADKLMLSLNDNYLANSPTGNETIEMKNYRESMCEGLEIAMATVEGAPTVATDINVLGKWISVKDRLPELDKEVIVYAVGKIDGFIGKSCITICNRFVQRIFPSAPGHEIWSSPWQYFHTDYEITHWMPLPEPPKEEDGND